MKKTSTLLSVITGLALFALATPSFAAKGKEVTITGEALCAKCSLHQAEKCQTVIQVDRHGKKVSYYLADNDTAKGFHKEVCQDPKKVTATGTVKKVDGKNELTVTKIEVK